MRNVSEVENANSRHGDFYRGLGKLPNFPLILVRAPFLGNAPSLGQGSDGRVTPWIAHGLSPRSSGSPIRLSRMLPASSTW
jgi:hypothetical protein